MKRSTFTTITIAAASLGAATAFAAASATGDAAWIAAAVGWVGVVTSLITHYRLAAIQQQLRDQNKTTGDTQ